MTDRSCSSVRPPPAPLCPFVCCCFEWRRWVLCSRLIQVLNEDYIRANNESNTNERQHHATVINIDETKQKKKINCCVLTLIAFVPCLLACWLAYTSPIRDKYAKFLNSLHLKVPLWRKSNTHTQTHKSDNNESIHQISLNTHLQIIRTNKYRLYSECVW